MATNKNPKVSQRLHPLESLGNLPARSGEIRVERIEDRLQPRVPFPHRHDFFHLLFIERGAGFHEIDFQCYRIQANQLFVMRPGEVHAWSLSPRTKGFVLEFTSASLPSEGGSARNPRKSPPVDAMSALRRAPAQIILAEDSPIPALLALMHAESAGKKASFRPVLENCLLAFLALLSRNEETSERPAGGTTEEFFALVEKYFRTEHGVEFYGAQMGLTAKSLTTKIKKALGKSAGAVIQDRCLVEAKRLLAYEDQTVSELAYELGYNDPNYFARFFRQREKMSPGTYRRLSRRTVHG